MTKVNEKINSLLSYKDIAIRLNRSESCVILKIGYLKLKAKKKPLDRRNYYYESDLIKLGNFLNLKEEKKEMHKEVIIENYYIYESKMNYESI
jgi:hypothetical protein